LDSNLCRDDEKDLELDSEALPNGPKNQPESEECSVAEIDPEQSTFSGLSTRATQIKNYLQEKTEATAIVLKQDGSLEEISYAASSSATRKLLGGRPSVVGEIEELNVVVLQSLDSSNGGDANKHTLPVPLCHHRAKGDYVVFRVDSEGKTGDVSLGEYQKYVEDHKTLTETAVKHYSAENEQIRRRSPFDGSSEALRGALESQILAECDSGDLSDAELRDAVKEGIQKLVDEAVSAFTASPMEDPDYIQEDDAEEQRGEEQEAGAIGHAFSSSVDDRSWRLQLEDALDHIRTVGREHGEHFAAAICSTFYELNGSEPALDQLTTLFAKIRAEFANEAAEEIDDETDAESESESEVDEEWQETLDHVRSIGERDGRILVHSICDAFYDDNGEELTLEELTGIWEGVQLELAIEAQEDADSEDEDEDQSEGEEAEYDPDNEDDAVLAQRDGAEDRQHALQHFDGVLLNTPMVSAKSGGGVSWNVFFDEDDLSEAVESSNLERAKEGFLKRNGREPTHSEVHRMRQFLAVPNELMEAEQSIAALSQSPAVVASSGAVSWTISFGESRGSLEGAVAAFARIYGREPIPFEVQRIRAFLAPQSERSRTKSAERLTPSKVLVSPVAEKKTAKRFNVYLEHSKLSQKENEDIAIKWFNHFNQREPAESDLSQIRAFIQKDSDLTEQSFLVRGTALNFDGEEDGDDGDDDDDDEEETKGVVRRESGGDEKGDDIDGDDEETKQPMKADDEEMVDIE